MATLLSVNNYYYYRGGAEKIFLEHNRIFEESGWKVVPFAMTHKNNLFSEWSEYFVDEIEFSEQYSFMGKLKRLPKVIYSIEARHKLSALLDDARPDICHAHNIYHHISPSILGLLKGRGVPVVLTLHDLKIACPAYNMLAPDGPCERCRNGRIYNVLVHRCIKGSRVLSAIVMLEAGVHRYLGSYQDCVNRFVVPSRFYIEKLCEWGFPRLLFTHVPNFVDPTRFLARPEPGDAFVYFGRLSREKGVATLIRSIADIGAKLEVVGTGPQEGELRALANDLMADVTFRGYMNGDALHDAVAGARAVVLPSEWFENAPMTVLEAYALGKPVIGARIGGIPELVREGETGFCFVSGDVGSLSSVLTRMLSQSKAQVEALGRNARRWVEEDFTAGQYRERIAGIYGDLGVGVPSDGNLRLVD